ARRRAPGCGRRVVDEPPERQRVRGQGSMSPPGPDAGSSAPIRRFLRQAGRIEQSDGSVLIWSIAEGRRGRRWRGSLLRGVSLIHSLLLEVTLVGRPSRLELATATGILTLHPEPDERSIHGNVVNAA